MNEFNQIVLLSTIWFTGLFILIPFFHRIGITLSGFLSFFIGLVIWVQGLLLSLYCFNSVKLSTIAIFIILLSIPLYITQFKNLKKFDVKDIRKLFPLLCLALLIFIFTSYVSKYLYFTPDSQDYDGLGRLLFHEGLFIEKGTCFEIWLSQYYSIFLSSLLAIGHLFNVKMLYSIFPTTSIMFTLLFYFLINKEVNFISRNTYSKIFFNTFLLLLLCLPWMYVIHSFYLNGNLLTGIFFSLSTFMFYLAIINKNQIFILLGFIFSSQLFLLRIEMAFFSIIPIFLFVILFEEPIERKWILFILFLIIGYQWYTFMFLFNEYKLSYLFNYNNSLNSAGNYYLYTQCLVLSILCYILINLKITQNIIKKYQNSIFFSLVIIVSIILVIFFSKEFTESLKNLLKLMFYNDFGGWGIHWYLILIAIPISLIFIFNDKSVRFLLYSILIFFWFRLILYTIAPSIADDNCWGSGNRMLLHIFPVSVFFFIVILSRIIEFYKNKYLIY